MCDVIIMPDGSEIESIIDGVCLCNNTQTEILTWIVQQLPEIEFDNKIEIVRDPMGWVVSIVRV